MKIKYPWRSEYAVPSYWDRRSPLWEGMPRIVNLYLDLNDNKLRRFFRRLEGLTLDTGCGDGRFIDCADIGVDFSRDMLEKANHRTDRPLLRADILHLPFRDKIFTSTFLVDVSLHIRDRERLFFELHRVSENIYDFLCEHRSTFPFILGIMRKLKFRPQRVKIGITLTLSMFLDRFKRLNYNDKPW